MVQQRKSPWDGPTREEVNETQIVVDLARSFQQEEDAIADYKARAETARKAGDNVTAELYEHVTSEEEEHAREFSKRIREIGGTL